MDPEQFFVKESIVMCLKNISKKINKGTFVYVYSDSNFSCFTVKKEWEQFHFDQEFVDGRHQNLLLEDQWWENNAINLKGTVSDMKLKVKGKDQDCKSSCNLDVKRMFCAFFIKDFTWTKSLLSGYFNLFLWFKIAAAIAK